MPRTTKDNEKDELNKKKITKKTKATPKVTKSKSTSTKKVEEKKSKATKTKSKEVADTHDNKVAVENTKKKSTTKKVNTTSTKKKSTTSTTKKKTVSKKLETNIVAEYYDLPYRYNETVVKILYQTPTVLFVYWDISDYDRENYIKQYGKNFFNNTKPILKVYNLTKNYSFEIEINDFANSWYINVNDANCVYKVELSRKKIDYVENLNSDYIYISSSNSIEFPNDHILLGQLPDKIKFRNVKNNSVSTKDISTLRLIGINKIYNVYDFYKTFYNDEILEEINSNSLINPSSW